MKALKIPPFFQPKAGKVPFAKLPTMHRAGLVSLYALLIVAMVAVLFYVGSQIRTRSYPVGSITLSTPYTRYLVGEEITFTITNQYNSAIFVANNCPTEPLEVYRLVNGTWKRIHDTADKQSCDQRLREVKVSPGKAVTGSFKPWKHLFAEAGMYRIVAYVDYYNSLPYQDIEVVAAPAVPSVPALLTPRPASASSTNPAAAPASAAQGGSSGQAAQNTSSRTKKIISLSMGTVSVEYTASMIYVLSIKPANGYTYEGGGSGPSVEITFKGGQNETQLQLTLQNGQLVQGIED